jgi:hypothetical protein
MMVYVALSLVATRLKVGADGFEIRWIRTRRFIAYDQVESISRYENGLGNSRMSGLRVALHSGEVVLLPIQRGRWESDQIGIIGERILEAKQAIGCGDVAVDAALLRRGDRPMSDWMAALRAIGTGANATLRTAPVPRDRLMRIVEDPTQAAAARAAAAVALAGGLDEEGRTRLRVAAEAIAAPKLRVAVEKVAEGREEAELEAALSEVDRDSPRVTAGR